MVDPDFFQKSGKIVQKLNAVYQRLRLNVFRDSLMDFFFECVLECWHLCLS